MIGLTCVHDAAGPHDGTRFLVERLWPRAVKKTALPVEGYSARDTEHNNAVALKEYREARMAGDLDG